VSNVRTAHDGRLDPVEAAKRDPGAGADDDSGGELGVRNLQGPIEMGAANRHRHLAVKVELKVPGFLRNQRDRERSADERVFQRPFLATGTLKHWRQARNGQQPACGELL
jgi:hypothetical protein